MHAVTAFGSAAYGYDADGCMVIRSAQTIRYDPERRPVRVDENGATLWRAAYDGDGSRRKRLDGKGTIHYVGPYERSVGNGQDVTEVVTKYYTASMGGMSRLVAMRKNGVLAYIGTDHLGGTIRVADGSFSALDRMRYTPYGVDRDPGTHLDTDHKFTSQVEDESIGLYWYASRAYDPALGRFTAPDTIVPGAGNPQALNRYSYVVNNPLLYVDPSGNAMRFFQVVNEGVFVVSQAEGWLKDLANRAGGPTTTNNTVTVSAGLIVSTVDIENRDVLLSHEMGHVMEARVLGPLYLPVYGALFGGSYDSFREMGYDDEEAGKMAYMSHPMEIQANWNVGLPKYWHVDHKLDPSTSFKTWKLEEVDLSGLPAPSELPDGAVPQVGAAAPSASTGVTVTIEFVIPAESAPGGVGVVGITSSNPSGRPAGGGSWDSPGGANAEADAAARRAAWERAGSPDYNELRRAGVPGY